MLEEYNEMFTLFLKCEYLRRLPQTGRHHINVSVAKYDNTVTILVRLSSFVDDLVASPSRLQVDPL